MDSSSFLYTLKHANPDLGKKYAFIKKSTIFTKSLQYFIKRKCLILTKFRNDWVKIVDFLINAYFLGESGFAWATLYNLDSSLR